MVIISSLVMGQFHLVLQSSSSLAPDGITTHKVLADEEEGLPFADNTFDLVVSSLRYG